MGKVREGTRVVAGTGLRFGEHTSASYVSIYRGINLGQIQIL